MRRALATLAFASIALAQGAALAQGLAVGRHPRETEADAEASTESPPRSGTLRGLLGVPVAERLLASDSAEDRLRGVARLGAIGTPEAIDALVDTLEQSSIVARDPRARLEAVRILAAHADREAVRPLLIRELSDIGPEGRSATTPLGTLTRAAAALALARVEDKKARAALVGAVLQGGPAGDTAARALVAHPPTSLSALLEGRRKLDPALATLLGELGDPRAMAKLRAALTETDQATLVAAALALASLGDAMPLGLARTWAKAQDVRLRRAGTEVLVRLGAKEAPEAITRLLGADATRLDGLRIALVAPSPALAMPIASSLGSLPAEEQGKAVAAIGRAGGMDAVNVLLGLLAKPDLATGAAFALATMPGKDARTALEMALGSDSTKKGAPRRLIVRAAIVRALALADEPRGLGDALASMADEKDPSDRAVSAFGRVATGRTRVQDAVEGACASGKRCDLPLIAAVARASLARGPEGPAELASVLVKVGEGAEPSAVAVAAGVVLLADPRGAGLPTALLARWAEGGGPLGPLAASALPSRDDEAVRGRIKRLLEGTDPVIRAHTALGLGIDPEPDAVTLLASAYRFEEDASVRRAIVRALSQRKEMQRKAPLLTARNLDPDDGVRALARAALTGRVLAPLATTSGGSVAWVSLVANDANAMGTIAGRAARIVRSDGLCVPVVADPDGVLLVPGLPAGPSVLALAPEAVSGDAPAP
jgi:HEAT repeat protein